MSKTTNNDSRGQYCGRAVQGVSNLCAEDLRQIEAHRAKERPTPWAHLARRDGVNELDLRAMFCGVNDRAEPVMANPPPLSLTPRTTVSEREARFRTLWNEGAPKSEISYLLGMTSPQMDRIRVKLGLEKRKEGAKPNGWTAEEDAAILRHYITAGMTAEAVGKMLGRTRTAVIGRAHRKGWTRRGFPEQTWNTGRSDAGLAA